MISLTQFNDFEYMDSVASSAAIYPEISDDSSPGRGEFTIMDLAGGSVVYLKAEIDSVPCGFFVFIQRDGGAWEQHTLLTDSCRGRQAILAGKMAIEEMIKAHGAKRFSSFCYSDKPHTMWYAKKLGYMQGKAIGQTTRHGAPVEIISFTFDKETQ